MALHRGARYILASVVSFSFVSLLVKSLPDFPFEVLVFWRGFTCLAITYYIVRRLNIPPWGNNRKVLLARGVLGTMALSSFFYSLHSMPLASAVTLQYLSPVFTVVVAGAFFGETVAPIHWLCSLMGFAGVYIIQGFDPRVGAFDASIGVLGALCSAFAYNSVRSLRDSDSEWVVMFYFPLIASLASAPFAYRKWVWPVGWEWLAILGIGIFTQFGQFFLTRGYQAARASETASMNYVGVLLATCYSVFLFQEQLLPATSAGMLMILFSVWLSGKSPAFFRRVSR